MKFTPVSYVIILMSLAWLTTSAQAKEANYLCYWQEADGTIRNLSSLCGSSTATKFVSPDAAFISNFQALAGKYSTDMTQALKNDLQENQEDLIAEAQTVCRVLKLGGRSAEKTRRLALAKTDPTPIGTAKRDLISTLAPNYYCPQFKSP